MRKMVKSKAPAYAVCAGPFSVVSLAVEFMPPSGFLQVAAHPAGHCSHPELAFFALEVFGMNNPPLLFKLLK